MAPVKGKSKVSKKATGKSAPKSTTSTSKKRGGPPPAQQTTKSQKSMPTKKRQKKQYTAEQLGVPKLNTITPVGVQKPRGKKKGKVFVDDPHTMQTILAIVNAETEGKIESKMLRSRQMEEIRDARRREAEAKELSRKETLEDKKDEIRQARRKVKTPAPAADVKPTSSGKKKKRVSFG